LLLYFLRLSLLKRPHTLSSIRKATSCCDHALFFWVQQGDLWHLLQLLKNTATLSEEQLAGLAILMSDFLASLSSVQPSAKREGFATVPDVTWEDVGALQDIREDLTMAILVNTQRFFLIQNDLADTSYRVWRSHLCLQTLFRGVEVFLIIPDNYLDFNLFCLHFESPCSWYLSLC